MNMEIKFKRDTSFRKQFFVPDSFAHPAKMDAQLLIWIVENYTKKWEAILDPMAGSGTTMLACGLSRNVILVELEEKFCKMMWDNWAKVRMWPQLGHRMGTCDIIQGDARQLEGLLVDKCIFSPPFAGQSGGLKSAESFMYGDDNVGKRMMGGIKGGTGDSPDNIDHLPYGSIDKIVTSPPYCGGIDGRDRSIEPHYDEDREKKYAGGCRSSVMKPYGNIDAVISSPPYEGSVNVPDSKQEARAGRLKKAGYDPKKYQGGKGRNLQQDWSYHPVDAVVTSPPYEDSLHRWEGISDKEVAKRLPQPYTDAKKDNIGNLKSVSYLEAMLQVYAQCWSVLKDGGLMILVTKNFIRNKQIVRLDTDTIKLCEQAGFDLIDSHLRKLPSQSFWRVIYHQKHPEVEQINYEDVLVFQKMELKV